MKNLIIVFVLIASVFSKSQAQISLDKVYGGFGMGVNYYDEDQGASSYMTGGVKFNLEAGYHINRKIGVGLDLGYSHGLGDTYGSGEILRFETIKQNRYLVHTRYKLFDTKISPYIKVSVGLTRLEEPNTSANLDPIDGAIRYGVGGSAELGLMIYGAFISYGLDSYGKTPSESTFHARHSDSALIAHAIQIGYIHNFSSYKK